MYVYILSEKAGHNGATHDLFTVGFHGPDGEFQPDSDHSSREDAAKRVHYLNGGTGGEPDTQAANDTGFARIEVVLKNVTEREMRELHHAIAEIVPKSRFDAMGARWFQDDHDGIRLNDEIAEFKIRTCRICGCTDDQACLEGCYWVEDDLCSSCVSEAARRLIEALRPLAAEAEPAEQVEEVRETGYCLVYKAHPVYDVYDGFQVYIPAGKGDYDATTAISDVEEWLRELGIAPDYNGVLVSVAPETFSPAHLVNAKYACLTNGGDQVYIPRHVLARLADSEIAEGFGYQYEAGDGDEPDCGNGIEDHPSS